jgi:hypothetical protein
LIGSTLTGSGGDFGMRLPKRPGAYVAKVSSLTVDDGTCTRSLSTQQRIAI